MQKENKTDQENRRAAKSDLLGNGIVDRLSARWRKALFAALFILVTAEFLLRGPVRVVIRAADYNDYTSSYIGAKAWVQGSNPYSSTEFWKLWEQSASHHEAAEEQSIGSRTPYPITCFLILAPLSLSSAPTASILLGLISSGLIVLSVWLLSRLPEFTTDARRWFFIVFALAMAPLHSGLGQINISMLAIACTFMSFWAVSRGRPATSGVFCAFALGLKPPIGGSFAVYYLISREWKALRGTVVTAGLLAIVAIGRLQLAGVPWLSSYLANSKLVLTDPVNAITAANPKRFQMINLQVLWYAITKNERLANELAFVAALVLLIVLVAGLMRRDSGVPRSLQVAALAVVSLIPIYHRFYDASLLIFALFWILSSSLEDGKLHHRLALFLMLPFLIPGAWALESLQNENRVSHFLTNHWWWEPVVLGHQIWAVFLLAVVLTAAIWKRSGGSRVSLRVQRSGANIPPKTCACGL